MTTARDQAIGAALVVVISVVSALAFMLLPFQAAGGIDCEAPLRGGEPTERAMRGFLVGREDAACDRRAGSRVTVGAIGGGLFFVIGMASVFAPQSRIERALFNDEDVTELYEG